MILMVQRYKKEVVFELSTTISKTTSKKGYVTVIF